MLNPSTFLYQAANLGMYIAGRVITIGDDTDQTIRSFASLPVGWDYGSGGPIEADLINEALRWNAFLCGQGLKTDAFPGGGGEIVISASYDDHYFEVILEPDATVSVAYDFQRKQAFYHPRKSPEEAQWIILDAIGHMGQIWSAFTSFTLGNTTPRTIGGLGLLSETIRSLSLHLGANVLLPQGQQSVNTFVSISEPLPELPAHHPFFGNLTRMTSLREQV
jgi:hypothetical protein